VAAEFVKKISNSGDLIISKTEQAFDQRYESLTERYAGASTPSTTNTMADNAMTKQHAKKSLKWWVSAAITGLVILALLAAAFMKFVQPGDYAQQAAEAGMKPEHLPMLGVLLTICALVYAIPMTRVLGAILITGYFGGALAAHMLAGDPIGNFVVPTLIPVLAWLGVYLIDERLRALLPVRR
jgi:hypothetical protein